MTRPERNGSDALWVVGIAAVTAAGYACYVNSDPGVGDSAEFQVLGARFGLTHAPGHPSYVGLAFVASRIPLGTVAAKVAILSALAAGVTTSSAFLLCRLLGASLGASLFASGALAASPTFALHATIAEVYTTQTAFIGISSCCVVAWANGGKQNVLFWAAVVWGVGVGIHLSTLLLGLPAAAFIMTQGNRGARRLVFALGGLGLGLCVSGALLVAAAANAPSVDIFATVYGPARSTWGIGESGFETISERLRFEVRAAPWTSLMLSDPAELPRRALGFVWGVVPTELGAWCAMLAAGGAAVVLQRRVAVLLLGLVVVNVAWVMTYAVQDRSVMLLPSIFLVCVLAGVGASRLLDAPDLAGVWRVSIVALAVVGFSIQVEKTLMSLRASGRDTSYPLVRGAIASLPIDALVVAEWSALYRMVYAATIDLDRADIEFIEDLPFPAGRVLPTSTRRRIEAAAGPVFSTRVWSSASAQQRFSFEPVHLSGFTLFRVTKAVASY